MNVFYTTTAGWEEDYFKNDIFNNDFYNFNITFILFNTNTIIENYTESKNVIVINPGVSLHFTENMIKILKPFAVFHLSDELGENTKYYDLYAKYPIKILFHQYNFTKVNYKMNHYQIPLGYVKHFIQGKSSNNLVENSIQDKIYDFAFIGSLKSDRNTMIDKFKNVFKTNFVRTGDTNWSNPMNQQIKPTDMYEIYKKTIFVPIGRGNSSLDCFRLYEAIVAGAIPVVVGDINEINITFNFNNSIPNIIIGQNWDSAVLLCENLYMNKDKLQDMINFNTKWWNLQTINIVEKINHCVSSAI